MEVDDYIDHLERRHHRAEIGCMAIGVLVGGMLGGMILGLAGLGLECLEQKRLGRREEGAERHFERLCDDAGCRAGENAEREVHDALDPEPDGGLVEGAPAVKGEAREGDTGDGSVAPPGDGALGVPPVEEFGGDGRVAPLEHDGPRPPVDAS